MLARVRVTLVAGLSIGLLSIACSASDIDRFAVVDRVPWQPNDTNPMHDASAGGTGGAPRGRDASPAPHEASPGARDALLDFEGDHASGRNDASVVRDARATGGARGDSRDAGRSTDADARPDADAGSCLRGIRVAGDVLDPGDVYLFGVLAEGSCSRAIAHWSTPNIGAVGFGCEIDWARTNIDPKTGRFLYADTYGTVNHLHEFCCDGCPLKPATYPTNTLLNDPLVSTAPCDPSVGFGDFMVAADGTVPVACNDGSGWYAAGRLIYSNPTDELVLVGHRGKALTQKRVIDLATNQGSNIVGLPAREFQTFRALPGGGFWAVLPGGTDDGEIELWRIDADGTSSLVGAYPRVPAHAGWYQGFTRLDCTGAAFTTVSNGLMDVVVRRTVDGPSEVVYDEATNPLVRLHGGALITGP
jgi:hypothetical protein